MDLIWGGVNGKEVEVEGFNWSEALIQESPSASNFALINNKRPPYPSSVTAQLLGQSRDEDIIT